MATQLPARPAAPPSQGLPQEHPPDPSTRRRPPVIVRVTASLAIATLSTLAMLRLWPEVTPEIAACVGAVLFAGLTLWWGDHAEAGAMSNLGTALLSGTLVAVAVIAIQADLDTQRQAAAEQQTLRLNLGLQQDLTGIDLHDRDLSGFYLRGKTLSEANLSEANLSGADLTDVDLTYANLTGADLSGTKLDGAILANATLPGASLAGAQLFSADLTNADLAGADLSDAFLAAAFLTDANLTDANLTGADLNAAGLASVTFDRAFTRGDTRWPPGFDWQAAGVRRRR